MLDKIIIQEQHRKKADFIFGKLKGEKIIAIGGVSGIGKTEIALCLQDLFFEHRRRYHIVSEDNFYLTPWRNRNRIRKQNKVIGIKEIDWLALETVVGVYKNIPCYDGVIVEGLYVNCIHSKDIGIFLEGTIKQTEEFRKLRQKESLTNFRKYVLRVEEREVLKTKSLADIIVPYNI